MAIRFKLPFGRSIFIGKRLYGMGRDQDDYFAVMQQRYGVDGKAKDKLKSYKGLVGAAVTLIGEQAGDYKPQIMRRRGDQLEDIGDHEFLQLLRRPSGTDPKATSMSQFDLFEATLSFLELQGEVYWYMAKGVMTGKPREIVVLRADKVGISISKETGDVEGYFIRRAVGEPIPMDVDEVLHFRYFNPDDPYHGKGKVELGEDYIGTDEATSKFTKNFFANNAGLSGVLNIKGEVSKGAFKKFVRAWRDKYEGVDNAGKVAIIRESEAAFTKVGLGLDELDMDALRKMTIKDVLLIFRVPLPLLGISDDAGLGRASIETLEYIFAKYNIDKKFMRFDAIMEIALARYYKGQDLTRDEIRDEDALDAVPGGDQLYVGINQIPLADAGTAETPPPAKALKGGIKLTLRRKVAAAPAPEEPKKKVKLKAKA